MIMHYIDLIILFAILLFWVICLVCVVVNYICLEYFV